MNTLTLDKDIINICISIGKKEEGGLIIVGDNVKYTPLVNQVIPSFKINDNLKLLEQLAKVDGAVIINSKKEMVAYGVKVKSDKVLKGFGTRNSAALSSSLSKDTTSYMISEEESKIKIFRAGKLLMTIDPFEKGIENKTNEIVNIFESIGIGTVGSLGVTALAPAIGIALIPGIVIFGSVHFIIKLLKRK